MKLTQEIADRLESVARKHGLRHQWFGDGERRAIGIDKGDMSQPSFHPVDAEVTVFFDGGKTDVVNAIGADQALVDDVREAVGWHRRSP